jgi:hypothetical protein
LLVLIANNIHACHALHKPILAFETDPNIFYEVLKPLLDAKLDKTIVQFVFNLDDDSPIKKIAKINLDCE